MSAYSAIPLAELPEPAIVTRKDAEQILEELKAWLIARDPSLAPVLELESEPALKILEAWAYRETLLRAEFDDAGRGNMLAFARGAQLDHLAALFGVRRAVVQAADPDAFPPVPEILEEDHRFRLRVQLSLEGATTAGPRGSYRFWGLTASPHVKDVGIESPEPGEVRVTVLSNVGGGTPDAALLDVVRAKLNDEEIRPITDLVTVQPATVQTYQVQAALTLYAGPDGEIARAAAESALRVYVEDRHRLGHDVTISGLHAALHQPGVQNVTLQAPLADIVIAPEHAAYCSSVSVTIGGRDV
jgi:phage-related baseplate assembly protein